MSRGIGLPTDGVPNQGWKLYITSLVMIVAAGLTTIARCATRVHTQQSRPDDYVIVCSLLFSITLSVAIQFAVTNGYGMHRTDLTRQELLMALKWFFIAQTPYKVVVGLNKVSAIIFYQRIFIGKGFQIACWTCMGIIVGWNIGAIAATIWQCIPTAGSWDKSIDAKCINSRAFWTAYAVGNILTDATVIVLPIPQVLKLQLRLREKVMLCGVFLLGGIVLIAGIVRTTAVQSSLAKQQDLTYNFIPRGIWTLIESNLGIITPCLPILKKPFNAVWSKVFGITSTSPSSYTTYSAGQSRQGNPQGKNADKSWPGSEVGAAGRPSARDTRTRRDSDDDVELLSYRDKATGGIDGSGIVRKDSWTVTVDADVLERSAHSGFGGDPGAGPSR